MYNKKRNETLLQQYNIYDIPTCILLYIKINLCIVKCKIITIKYLL
jgi:hypothetical protein